MLPMAGTEPGDRMTPGAEPGARRLAQPPSTRYAGRPGGPGPASGGAESTRSALPGPLARALVVGVAGAGALVAVGAIFASTAGLLFTSGAAGAGVGLVLARAAVPRNDARPVTRRAVAWLAIGLAIAAVVVGAVVTWLFARQGGGTLGPVDYLLTTFGPFVPAEAVIAALAAAWGASAGPVQG